MKFGLTYHSIAIVLIHANMLLFLHISFCLVYLHALAIINPPKTLQMKNFEDYDSTDNTAFVNAAFHDSLRDGGGSGGSYSRLTPGEKVGGSDRSFNGSSGNSEFPYSMVRTVVACVCGCLTTCVTRFFLTRLFCLNMFA